MFDRTLVRPSESGRVNRHAPLPLRLAGWTILAAAFMAGGCAKPDHFQANFQSENAGDRILAIRQAGEAKDRKAVPQIVDRLDDEDDGVRFFAILALERITGTRLGFDYAAPHPARYAAVARWRDYVRAKRHLTTEPDVGSRQAGSEGFMEGGESTR